MIRELVQTSELAPLCSVLSNIFVIRTPILKILGPPLGVSAWWRPNLGLKTTNSATDEPGANLRYWNISLLFRSSLVQFGVLKRVGRLVAWLIRVERREFRSDMCQCPLVPLARFVWSLCGDILPCSLCVIPLDSRSTALGK